jgi:hypothetical protein
MHHQLQQEEGKVHPNPMQAKDKKSQNPDSSPKQTPPTQEVTSAIS